MNAFTPDEKLVFAILARANEPLSLYAIYTDLAARIASNAALAKSTEPKFKAKKYKKEIEQLASGFVSWVALQSFLELKSKDLIRRVHEINKTYGTHIPTYKTTRRICEDFSDAGLLGRRTIGKKTLYYLPAGITESYQSQLKQLGV